MAFNLGLISFKPQFEVTLSYLKRVGAPNVRLWTVYEPLGLANGIKGF